MRRSLKLAPVVAAAGAVLVAGPAHAGLGDAAVGTMSQGWAKFQQGGGGGLISVEASFYGLPAGSQSYITLYAHYQCSDNTAENPAIFTAGPFKADRKGHFTVRQTFQPASTPDIGSTRSVGLVKAADGSLRGCDSVPVVSQG